MLPGLFLTAILPLRRRPVAFVPAPILMVFCILTTAAVAGMMLFMDRKGLVTDYTLAPFFLASAAGCAVLLLCYLRAGTCAV
jgi:hypothetical protein